MLMRYYSKKISNLPTKQAGYAPILIIKKNADDADGKEFRSIEEALADLGKDPNVPSDKIEQLKSSLKKLKNKTSITIRNGEII